MVIAQAILESGWNLNAKSLFGIKGDGFSSITTEYVDGQPIDIIDCFKSYPDLTSSIIGYFDLMQWDNYNDVTSATNYEQAIDGLTNDIGYKYATDPNYGKKLTNLIEQYELYLMDDDALECAKIQNDDIELIKLGLSNMAKGFGLCPTDEATQIYANAYVSNDLSLTYIIKSFKEVAESED